MFHEKGKQVIVSGRFSGSFILAVAVGTIFSFQTSARALTVPFIEDFTSNSANWYNATGVSPLGWQSSGGPDGSGYASGTFNFVNSLEDDGPAVVRAQDEFNSSGNAFVGNWNTGGVTSFSAYVRQNTGEALSYFVRFSTPFNFPGALAIINDPIPSGVWTQITIPIVFGGFIYEGAPISTHNSAFGNLGHIQIGAVVPASLAGLDQTFSFDVDQAQIVPEPTAMALMLACGLALIRSRQRKAEIL